MKKGKNNKGFGLVEIMITLAVIALIVDMTSPYVKSYINTQKQEETLEAAQKVAMNNVKTYVNQINQEMVLKNQNDGSYYIPDFPLTVKGITLPSDDSWIVIKDSVVTQGLFKEPCAKTYAYIEYDGDKYKISSVAKLTAKPEKNE